MKKSSFTLLALLLAAFFAQGQSGWNQFDKLMNDGSYKSAYAWAEGVYNKATTSSEQLSAAYYMTLAASYYQEDVHDSAEARYRELLPKLDPLEKALCYAFLSEYDSALVFADVLKKTPVERIKMYCDAGQGTNMSPTAYDVVVLQAQNSGNYNPQQRVELQRQLLAFHAADGDDLRLWHELRLLDLLNNVPNHRLTVEKIKEVLNRYRGSKSPLVTKLYLRLAQYYNAREDNVQALCYCDTAIARAPKSEGGINCSNLRNIILQKRVEMNQDGLVVAPGALSLQRVRYRNLDQLWWRIIPYDSDYRWGEKTKAKLRAAKVLKSGVWKVEKEKDYKYAESYVLLPALKTGKYLLLVSLNSLQSGMLNSMGYFAAAALTPVLLNLTMIASLFALTPLFGGNYGYALSAGVTLAGVFQLLWLIWHTHRAGLPLGLQAPAAFFKRKSQELKLLMKRIIPGVFGSGIYQINLFLDTLFVSFLSTGAISWLYYANRLYQLPVGIIGAAIGTALLPILSRQLKAGETEQAQNSLNRALEFALLMSVPSMAGLMALSYPVISVLFERGEFTNTDSVNTAVALCAYAAGLPAYILTKTLAPVFYARGDTTTPVRIAAWALGLYILLCAAFLPKFGYVGIALATGIVAWINVLQYIFRIKKKALHHTDRTFKKRTASILISTAIMTAAVIFANRQTAVHFPDWVHGAQFLRFGILTGLIAFGGIVFTVSVLLSGGVSLKELKARLCRKKG